MDQTQHDLEPEFLTREMDDRSINLYYSSMTAFARVLGANEERAEREMREALKFEIELIKVIFRFNRFIIIIICRYSH